MTDRQCPSCGGFCEKSGCERENVSPKPVVGFGTPGRSITISYELFTLMKAQIEELKSENFKLAAGHCIIDGAKGLTADEGGAPYCAMEKKVERLEEAVDMAICNLSMFNQTNNNQFFDEAFDALQKVYPK